MNDKISQLPIYTTPQPTDLIPIVPAASGTTSAITYSSLGIGVSAVASVTNSDGSLTISPTSGAVVAAINTAKKNTWTNGATFTNAAEVQVANLNTVLLADSFPGSDIGAKINAAYAALPSTGGVIDLQNSQYSYSTPIVMNTPQKFPLLRGAPGGGSTLTYTALIGTACTINVSKQITTGYGMENLKFCGVGPTNNTTGIFIGGLGADDGLGAAGITLRNVHVGGPFNACFGTGLETGNNVFIITIDNCVFNFNAVNVFCNGGAGASGGNTINSGENMRFVNCTFADAYNQTGGLIDLYGVNLQISGICDYNFIGCSFDDSQLYCNLYGGTANEVNITNCHFENPNGHTYPFIITNPGWTAGGTVAINIANTAFVQDASPAPTEFINLSSGTLNMSNVTAVNNASATASYFVNFATATNVCQATWTGFQNANSAVTYMTSTSVYAQPIGVADGAGNSMVVTEAGKIYGGTFNNVTVATPATAATLELANNSTFETTGAYTTNITSTAATAVTLPTSGTLATLAGTETYTNKRITPRVLSAAAYTTNTGTSINGDTMDMFIVTAQTGALKFNNPTGTPTDGQKLIISVASSTTSARALTWDTAYGATTVALPTTTAATTATLTIGFIWSASKSLWQCVASA